MATHPFLDNLVNNDLYLNSGLSSKINALSKKLAEKHGDIKDMEGFNEILSVLSPAEQKFWCLSRIKNILETCLDSKPVPLYKKLEGPLKDTTDQQFEIIINQFSDAVVNFLNNPPDFSNNQEQAEAYNTKKTKLLNMLAIQATEFAAANKDKQRCLVMKGLACLTLSTASVMLVVMQGTACAILLSLPATAFLALSGSYAVLAYETDPLTALGNAMHWFQHLSTNTQAHGAAGALFLGIKYYQDIKPEPFLEDMFKSAQKILPDVPKEVFATAAVAAIPPLYFLNQYNQSCRNTSVMDDLFEIDNEELKTAKVEAAQRLGM